MSEELFVKKDEMSFKFYQEEGSSGWIEFQITFPNYSRTIAISIACSPIEKMIDCMEQIILNNLPNQFYIDEEGKGVQFLFFDMKGDNKIRFELRDYLDLSKLFYSMIVNRFDFCEKLMESWSNFIKYEYRDDLWNNFWLDDYNLKDIDIDNIFNLLNKMKSKM